MFLGQLVMSHFVEWARGPWNWARGPPLRWVPCKVCWRPTDMGRGPPLERWSGGGQIFLVHIIFVRTYIFSADNQRNGNKWYHSAYLSETLDNKTFVKVQNFDKSSTTRSDDIKQIQHSTLQDLRMYGIADSDSVAWRNCIYYLVTKIFLIPPYHGLNRTGGAFGNIISFSLTTL